MGILKGSSISPFTNGARVANSLRFWRELLYGRCSCREPLKVLERAPFVKVPMKVLISSFKNGANQPLKWFKSCNTQMAPFEGLVGTLFFKSVWST